MATDKDYLHDHFVLLLLSVNSFLAVAGSLLILLRLSSSRGTGYIVQYRPTLGITQFRRGSVIEIYSFIVFALVVLGFNYALSYRAYKVNRSLALTIISLGTVLILLSVIIANALLLQR